MLVLTVSDHHPDSESLPVHLSGTGMGSATPVVVEPCTAFDQIAPKCFGFERRASYHCRLSFYTTRTAVSPLNSVAPFKSAQPAQQSSPWQGMVLLTASTTGLPESAAFHVATAAPCSWRSRRVQPQKLQCTPAGGCTGHCNYITFIMHCGAQAVAGASLAARQYAGAGSV